MIVRTAITDATERLAAAGCANSRVDAEHLVGAVLGASRTDLYAAPERELSDREQGELDAYTMRRCRREPLAYILGEWGFRGLTLCVTPAVLIPRPETELVVESCLGRVRPRRRPRVLDIGTGSGAIALSIASEHEGAHVTATDISDAALDVAKLNAAALELDARVTFVCGDMLAAQTGPFDLVVSNPPYVALADYESLEPEVVDHEPRVALFGTGFHARIAAQARDVLSDGGWLVLECGENETAAVAFAIGSLGYGNVSILADLTERPRIVEAQHLIENGAAA